MRAFYLLVFVLGSFTFVMVCFAA